MEWMSNCITVIYDDGITYAHFYPDAGTAKFYGNTLYLDISTAWKNLKYGL